MVKKTYRDRFSTRNLRLFRVGDELFEARFDGGSLSPIRVNGKFTTSDPEEQKAIESLPDFNSYFFLERTEAIDEVVKAPEAIEAIETPEEMGIKEVDWVKNILDAKKCLTDDFADVTYAQLKNKLMVMNVMKKKSYYFPNWLNAE